MREQLLFCPFDGQALLSVDQADAFIGLTLEDKYHIEEKIGEGGMGKVYRATHVLMDHTVAIKILHPHLSSDHVAVERFRREARAAASIRHPNAVAVTDFGVNKETGLSYLVMEFLEGVELRDEMKEKLRLDFEEAFIITQQICSALQAAHAKGIIHRDLKPDNIWLVKSDDHFPRVKVLDFGIAKLLAGNVGNLTQQGVIVGTPYYMSPEQCVGDELDARSDIYSLGIIIYEILTGRVPFRASTPMGVALKHANEAPKPPHEFRSDLPFPIEDVILRALRKHREERQSSAMELSQEFESALYQAGVELKLLGTKTPPDSHTLSTYADHAYKNTVVMPPSDRSFPPEKSFPPDRSTPPERPTGGASAVMSRPLEPPLQPETRVATPVMFQEASRPHWALRDLLSETSLTPRVLFIGLGALFVAVAVITIVLLTRPHVTSTTTSTPNNTAPTPPAGMVYVPEGKFVMGYNGSVEEAEKPEHEVTLPAFFIDKYEVTVGEYYQFIKATKRPEPKNWPASWKDGRFTPQEAKLPVTDVTWFDARDYAKSVGKRLPSEEEWEYAARGTDKRLYPWGNTFNSDDANVGELREKVIKPVGSFPVDKSPFGVYDLAGNVFEWVASDWSAYPSSKAPPTKAGKMVRGGSYTKDKSFAMAASRSILRTDAPGQDDVGFRCAKDASK